MDAKDIVNFLYFLWKQINITQHQNKFGHSLVFLRGIILLLPEGKGRKRGKVAAFADLSLVELSICPFSIQLSKHFYEY